MYKKAANETKSSSLTVAKNLGENLRETAEGKVGEILTNIEKAANVAGQQVRDFYEKASSEANNTVKAVSKKVKEKPIQSSLIALSAGFILGLIFRR